MMVKHYNCPEERQKELLLLSQKDEAMNLAVSLGQRKVRIFSVFSSTGRLFLSQDAPETL